MKRLCLTIACLSAFGLTQALAMVHLDPAKDFKVLIVSIDPIARGMDRLDALLRGTPVHPLRNEPVLADLDRFAHFRCDAHEWPAN